MPDVKIKKDGQEYGIGVIPQSMYDDVEDLKDEIVTKVSNEYNILTSGSLLTFAEGLSDGMYLFRTNQSVTDVPFMGYHVGYVLVINNNRKIVIHDIFSEALFVNSKTANGSWIGWFGNMFTSGGKFRGNLTIDKQDGTASAVGSSLLSVGNNIAQETAKNSRGYVDIYGTSAYFARLRAGALTDNRYIDLPNKNGTLALTSDISSRKYKENINEFTDEEAKKLLNIEMVTFDYKEGITGENERYGNRGVIAEQVEPLIPYVVEHEKTEESEEETLRVDYRKFIPYLIKMVQMQQEEIDNLKAEISALKMN